MTAMPALTGDTRPELITLAEDERATSLARLDTEIRTKGGNAPAELVDQLAALYREVALRQTDYGWWLNHVDQPMGPDVNRLFTADDKARLAEIAGRR